MISDQNQDTRNGESTGLPSELNNKVLMKVKSSMFLDYFSDELIIQEKSISVVHHHFLSYSVYTISTPDVSEVVYTSNLWHSQLTIVGKSPQQKLSIENLPAAEATKAKNLIEQLMINSKERKDKSS